MTLGTMLFGEVSVNDVVVAICAALPPTLAALAALVTSLRTKRSYEVGKIAAQLAHSTLSDAVTATHDTIANVAGKVGAEVAPLPVDPTTETPTTPPA